MTGPEIAAVGKAVEIVGKKVLGQDGKTKDVVLNKAKETAEMQAAGHTYAARVAVKEQILLRLYRPLARMLGISEAYFRDVFPKEMADKVAAIPEEHLITPKASVAIPAMQGLGYSFDEPNLKELYLNLLTTATDDRRAGSAHPAFAEVVKQLSAPEVKVLNKYLSISTAPICRIDNLYLLDEGQSTVYTHVLDIKDELTGEPIADPLTPMWVDNWIRLGLVSVTYEDRLVLDRVYDFMSERPEWLTAQGLDWTQRLAIVKGIIERTDFGEHFHEAVSPPTEPDLE